jgi:hypothetical protein
MRNNNICFKNRLIGELEYPLPLQDYVNQAFNPEGGSLVRKISDLV